ncbi:putative transcriptional regulator [Oceanithermus profundus DSM 14977]|uniref:Putative transcriptional regulator n=1 Tax=Oceanithermus profundus (strain DSM 14977 / NBRC 100410 / VKM B-2274 / 506) TaxID=670487 RepID=E4U5Z0_OCEP5|nr:ATP-binding protein [Oceanithermus profundus]ADR35811.1 putative transcriptional regulator [Oceanithermus profundus DSM 14977]
MTEAEVYQALLEGPNERRVLLGAQVAPEALARYAAGLANRDGGVILLGARPSGGVEDAGGLEPLQLSHALFELTAGAVLPHVERVETAEGVVWALHVAKSPYVVSAGAGPAPYWDGARLVAAPAGDAAAAPPDPTARPLPEAGLDDLDPAELARIEDRLRERGSPLAEAPPLERLQALGMAREVDGRWVPSVTGLLLAGRPAALARLLPQAEVSYYRHEDDDVDYAFREDLLRPIPAALERLRELIQGRNRFHPLTVGLFRLEVWDFDVEVYREGLLNAFVHRDWTAHATVQVHHHPDRLEIANPGGLPAGMTPENILRHPPHRRNPALAAALARLGYVERAGQGVDKMYRLMLRYGKEPPEYRAWPHAVTLVLHNPGFDAEFVRWVSEAQNRQGSFTLDYLIVAAALRRGPRPTAELARALALEPPQTRKLLARMEAAGLIVPEGQGRGRRWRLAPLPR